MNLGRGKIGACVVMASLAAAIIGGWALSTDVTDQTITTYESVADISGYFDSSNKPIYIEYNPVDNYTGYYTSSSDPYFGGVTFTESARANTAPISQATTTIASGTKTISAATSTAATISYVTPAIQQGALTNPHYRTGAIYKVTSVLDYWSMTATANVFKLTSIQNYTALTPSASNIISADCNFYLVDSWNYWLQHDPSHAPSFHMASIEYLAQNPTSQYFRPCLSCIVDLDKQTAELYYDNQCTELCGIYALSSVYVFKDPGTTATSGDIQSSPSFTYKSYNRPDPVYMDTSRGVRMES